MVGDVGTDDCADVGEVVISGYKVLLMLNGFGFGFN